MTAIPVHLSALKCDGCGTTFMKPDATDATAIRLLAAKEGWKYLSRVVRGNGRHGTAARKVYDACPACDLPAVTP